MEYKKTNPEIKYIDFIRLVAPLAAFNSVEGNEYVVNSISGSIMTFTRMSTGKQWTMDLKQVLKAYHELTDFKTANFKPYVPLTHSPALGLLLKVGLHR